MKPQPSTLLLTALLGACAMSDQPEKIEAKRGFIVVNGIERSELALTMRQMTDELKLVRDSLAAGHEVSPSNLARYRSIHTDTATERHKIDTAYHNMAALFLAQYEAFERDTTDKAAAFNAMLDGCVACHQSKCPGPIKAISKLRLQ